MRGFHLDLLQRKNGKVHKEKQQLLRFKMKRGLAWYPKRRFTYSSNLPKLIPDDFTNRALYILKANIKYSE
jgi:hypothetical protein